MPTVNNVMLTNLGSYFLFNNLAHLSGADLDTVLTQYKTASLNYQYAIQTGIDNAMYPATATDDDKRVALRYISIGIGGNRFNDITNTKIPFNPQASNANLFYPIPVKILTLDDDNAMTPEERALLRLRQEVVIDEISYAIYWLRLLTIDPTSLKTATINIDGTTSDIQFTNLKGTDPQVPYLPNSNDGTTFNPDTSIITASTMSVSFAIPREDIKNVINVLFKGDLSYGVINEFGLCVGADISTSITINTSPDPVTVTDVIEAFNTYLVMHQCTNGVDLMISGSDYQKTLIIADNNAVIQ